jgi:hypothetical protein
MSGRSVLSGLLVLVCVAALWGIWRQQNQLASLRAEQQQMQAQMAAGADSSAPNETPDPGGAGPVATPTLVVTPELLRLRSEVTRLTERRRELAGERAENERLRAQLASRGTNAAGGIRLPPGYIRRSEARNMGYTTPENTLQTFLWAIHNRDLTNFLQTLAPDTAEKFRAQAGQSGESIEEFFNQARGIVGMCVVNRKPESSDGSISLEVEVVPGASGPRITFRQFDGQWRIAGGL